LRSLNNLILHFTTRTDDSHAVPIKINSLNKIKSAYKINFSFIGKIPRGLSN